MTLRVSTDAREVGKRLAGEVDLAALGDRFKVGEGALEASIKAGDLCWTDDVDPRVFVWVHPVGTVAEVIWIGGPSDSIPLIFKNTVDLLLAKAFVTARFRVGLPTANRAAQLTTATVVGDTATVSLAQAKTKLRNIR